MFKMISSFQVTEIGPQILSNYIFSLDNQVSYVNLTSKQQANFTRYIQKLFSNPDSLCYNWNSDQDYFKKHWSEDEDFQKFKSFLMKSKLSRLKDLVNSKLLEMYSTQLDKAINNYTKKRAQLKYQKLQCRKKLKDFTLSVGQILKKLPSNSQEFKDLIILLDDVQGISQNLRAAKLEYDDFQETKKVPYLNKAISLLMSANKMFVPMSSPKTCYKKCYRFSSNHKYDFFSSNYKNFSTKKLLNKQVEFYKEHYGYETNILTLAPVNVPYEETPEGNTIKTISAEHFKDLSKIINRYFDKQMSKDFASMDLEKAFKNHVEALKKSPKFKNSSRKLESQISRDKQLFFSNFKDELEIRPRLNRFFKGYFGVLEVTYEKNGYNLHYHFIVLREPQSQEKTLDHGFISKFYISKHFEYICQTFSENFKLSRIADIRKINKDHVSYVVKYLNKLPKIKSNARFKEFKRASEGVRIIRSGGLFSQQNWKTHTMVYELLDIFKFHEKNFLSFKNLDREFSLDQKLDEFYSSMSQFSKTQKKRILYVLSVHSNVLDYYKDQGYSIEERINQLLFNKSQLYENSYYKIPRVKTYTYEVLREIIFEKPQKLDPYFNVKLEWGNKFSSKDISSKKDDLNVLIDFFYNLEIPKLKIYAEKLHTNYLGISKTEYDQQTEILDHLNRAWIGGVV